ncbi:MAG: hypothetical protein K9K66_09360 [Desulfarculaceae bacterium]|nr:hypothetical protein [Desulfarculaceae bacterium]MCF8073060.1 hypothetical protein [Desulfarculaceae bacterium]MCF8101855.1 hypothetical protein [Desulfarculaceae bacterium]MCF8115382.1 hypothetical protein [Desulfarculaceae bacterium]
MEALVGLAFFTSGFYGVGVTRHNVVWSEVMRFMFLMRRNLDIIFGVIAWAIGLCTIVADQLPLGGYTFEWIIWVAPLSWSICVVLMFTFISRKAGKLWWVWPSFPFAFMAWILVAIILVGAER